MADLEEDSTNLFEETEESIDSGSSQAEHSADASIRTIDLDQSEAEHLDGALMNSLKLSDSDMDAVDSSVIKDLFVTVDDPEKHVGGYVSYAVKTKTTRGQFDNPEYCVRRRYQDFLWLRQRLEENNPTHIIPPLPEKHTLTHHFDRFTTEFLKTRQAALNRFICRVADHPILSFNDHFHVFLTAKTWELTSVKKTAPGVMSRMGDSMKNMASYFMVKKRDPEFTEMAEYCKNFADKISAIDRASDKIARDRFDVLESLKEYGPVFRLWANSEVQLADPLSGIADAIDDNITSLKNLLRAHDARFAEPFLEYLLYTEAVKSALKKRDAIQMEYDLTVEELGRKRAEKDELENSAAAQARGLSSLWTKDPEKNKQQRLDRLSTSIDELVSAVEVCSDKAECANHDLLADMERWHKSKRTDLVELFTDFSDRHVTYYKECMQAWERALEVLQKSDDPETT